MNCQTIEREIQLYLDGNLSAQREETLLAHAAICPTCAQTMAEEKSLLRLIAGKFRPKRSAGRIFGPGNGQNRDFAEGASSAQKEDGLVGVDPLQRVRQRCGGRFGHLFERPGWGQVLFNPSPAPIFVAEEPTATTPAKSQPDKTSVAQGKPNGATGQQGGAVTQKAAVQRMLPPIRPAATERFLYRR